MKKKKMFIVLAGLVVLLSPIVSSCNVVGGLFATPTPTPTMTFTPTMTPSPTPTFTPTNTPTPTATPLPTGKHVEVLDNGTLVFVDYDMKYGMAYPSTWHVVPFGSDDEAAATEKLIAVNSVYKDLVEATKAMTDFIAIKPTEGNSQDMDAMATGLTLEGDTYAQISLKDVLASQQVPAGATVVFNDVVTNGSGVEMGLLEYDDSTNHTIVSIFKTKMGAVIISIATPSSKFESMSQELIDIINAIGLLE